MIYEMLKKIDIVKIMNGGVELIQIWVQIYYVNLLNLKLGKLLNDFFEFFNLIIFLILNLKLKQILKGLF